MAQIASPSRVAGPSRAGAVSQNGIAVAVEVGAGAVKTATTEEAKTVEVGIVPAPRQLPPAAAVAV